MEHATQKKNVIIREEPQVVPAHKDMVSVVFVRFMFISIFSKHTNGMQTVRVYMMGSICCMNPF